MSRLSYFILALLLGSLPVAAEDAAPFGAAPAFRADQSGNGTSIQEYYDVGGKAEYFFGAKGSGELQIKVNLWGKVMRPGLYDIPIKTDLVTLMSLAGGPDETARLDNIRIIRHVKDETIVMNVDVKKYLHNGDLELIPVLMPGDTILISGSTLHLFSLTVKVLGQIMTAVNFYFFVTNVI